jgi:hypothetical protein
MMKSTNRCRRDTKLNHLLAHWLQEKLSRRYVHILPALFNNFNFHSFVGLVFHGF